MKPEQFVNPTPLLNRAKVRALLMDLAAKNRAHKYTRVSEETLRMINDKVYVACMHHVGTIPSKGRTL